MNNNPENASIDTPKQALEAAIKIVGGQTALAKILGIKQQTVNSYRLTGLPPRRVLAVEKATNYKVTRHQLCPYIYPCDEYTNETLRKP